MRDLPSVAESRRVEIRGCPQVGRRGRFFKEGKLKLVKDFNLGQKADVFDSPKMMGHRLQSFLTTTRKTTGQSRWVGVYRT